MREPERILTDLPSWDLSDLFSGIDDPRIDAVMTRSLEEAQAFEKAYRARIADDMTAETLREVLEAYERILQEAEKPFIFAHVVHAADSKNSAHGALMQKTQAAYTKVYQALLFLELALVRLSDDVLKTLAENPVLENYHTYLSHLIRQKPHRLSEEAETIFADMDQVGRSAFVRLFDEDLSAKIFSVTLDGTTYEWPEEQVLNLLHDADRARREAGAKALTAGLREDMRRLAFVHNTIVHDKEIRDRYQKFDTPESSRHLANNVTQDIVDAMSAAVTDGYAIVHDYYTFKRKLLGLDMLYDYDRYAPVPEAADTLFSFDEAREVVLRAYERFSSVFHDTAEQFFEKRWIDAASRPGKRAGAFCMSGTPDGHPYVFMNYLGKPRSVLTLAHELGHGVHAALARKQTLLNFETPLVVAETASVFGELLVFEDLKARVDNPKAQFALTMNAIEDMFATIFRQHAMYKFEQDIHKARRVNGELSVDALNTLWRTRQEEMFGKAVTLTKDYDIWWSYIPHFLHTPFYVYAYVFGELLTVSLYEQYRYTHAQDAFVRDMIEMLAHGGSRSPQQLVNPFGIDLTDVRFWQGGIERVRALVEEAKTLHKGL